MSTPATVRKTTKRSLPLSPRVDSPNEASLSPRIDRITALAVPLATTTTSSRPDAKLSDEAKAAACSLFLPLRSSHDQPRKRGSSGRHSGMQLAKVRFFSKQRCVSETQQPDAEQSRHGCAHCEITGQGRLVLGSKQLSWHANDSTPAFAAVVRKHDAPGASQQRLMSHASPSEWQPPLPPPPSAPSSPYELDTTATTPDWLTGGSAGGDGGGGPGGSGDGGGFGGLAPGGNGLGGGSGGGARGSGGGVGDGGGGERSHPFSVPQEAHPSNSHCRAHGGDEVRHMNDLERHGLICCLVGFPWGTYRILAAPARTRGWWRRSCADPVACRSAGHRGRGLRWRRRSRWRGN